MCQPDAGLSCKKNRQGPGQGSDADTHGDPNEANHHQPAGAYSCLGNRSDETPHHGQTDTEADAYLEESRGLVNDELLEMFDSFVDQVKDVEEEETLERLQQRRKQIVAKMTILRA